MRASLLLSCASLPLWTLATQGQALDEREEGTARFWTVFPPYHDVDLAANFNKLRSPGDVAFFVVRDTVVVSCEF